MAERSRNRERRRPAMLAIACALLLLALTAGLAAAAPHAPPTPAVAPSLGDVADAITPVIGAEAGDADEDAPASGDELPEATWLDDALVDLAQLELATLEQLEQDPLVPLDDRRASRWGRLDLTLTIRQVEREPASTAPPTTVSELWLVATWRN